MNNNPLLQIRDLKKHYPVSTGGLMKRNTEKVLAVDGVDLTLFFR